MNRFLRTIATLIKAVDVEDARDNFDKRRKHVGNIAREGYRRGRRRVQETKNALRQGHGSSIAKRATGFVTGLGIGLGIGLLFAPAKGKQSRQKLGDAARTFGSTSPPSGDVHENPGRNEGTEVEDFVGGMSRQAIEIQKAQETNHSADREAI